MPCNIRACKGSAQSSFQYSWGLNPAQIDMAILMNLLLWYGAGQYWNAVYAVRQSQHTGTANQSQPISVFGRRAFIKPGTNRAVCARLMGCGWIQIQLLPPYIYLNPPISTPKYTNLHLDVDPIAPPGSCGLQQALLGQAREKGIVIM